MDDIKEFGDLLDVLVELKPPRKRKSTAGKRKIHHIWTDEEISNLISSVEKHRGLWDFASADYKLNKMTGWQSVADELEIDGVDAKEAKVKWLSLRTTYMVNLGKLRKKKSRPGTNKFNSVTWKFFKEMMFLKRSNVQNSTSSTSTLNMELRAQSSLSQSEPTVCNQRKISRSIPSVPSPSADSSSSQAISNLNTSVDPLRLFDANSTFCDNLLAELRTLSDSRSRALRYKISRLMMEFMETNLPDQNFIQIGNETGDSLSNNIPPHFL